MTFDLDKDGLLDSTPLKFGKFKGQTPEQVALKAYRGDAWLVWAYETVGNFDVCSAALYKDCGGKGVRAKSTRAQPNPDYVAPPDRYESRGSSPARPTSFEDFDDDIPF